MRGPAARRAVGGLVLLGLLLPSLAAPLASAQAGAADCPMLQQAAAHGQAPAIAHRLLMAQAAAPEARAAMTHAAPHGHGAAAHGAMHGHAAADRPDADRPAGAPAAEGCGPAACCPADLADGLIAPPPLAARAERGFGLARAALPAPGEGRERPPRLS